MNIPRFMIAGTHSGVGKTTITTALMAALTEAGYSVQPFKAGPDYIDPSYHTIVTGNKSRNLDTWILDETTVCRVFTGSAAKADLAVIEGVMGVFDGSSGIGEQGSSAHIAKLLRCPVILIVDVRSMARSAAALVMGFKDFDPGLDLAGVILNRIGSDRHLSLVREAIESTCNVPVIGYVRKNTRLELPSRHLGLVPTVEGGYLKDTVTSLAAEIREGIDLWRLLKIAESADELSLEEEHAAEDTNPINLKKRRKTGSVRIAIAMDEAFSFYYQDGLETLEWEGAQLVPFSPLNDRVLPEEIDGMYIGGGFPEVFIDRLAANEEVISQIRAAGAAGMPIYAECGGLMYLTRAIIDFDGNRFPMVGLVPGSCIMEKKLVGMGYVESEALTDNIIASKGQKARGHEFHYSRIEPEGEDFRYAFRLVRNRYRETVMDGFASENILASYVHHHFTSDPGLARRFVGVCQEYQKKRLRMCCS